MSPLVFVGIDVSLTRLDIALRPGASSSHPHNESAIAAVVAWALTITDLDPLRFGLLFERFLNPERVSPPDFDIDFCMRRRDEVIRYVREKYGRDCVANIVTFGTLGAKAAIRDAGLDREDDFAELRSAWERVVSPELAACSCIERLTLSLAISNSCKPMRPL